MNEIPKQLEGLNMARVAISSLQSLLTRFSLVELHTFPTDFGHRHSEYFEHIEGSPRTPLQRLDAWAGQAS